MAKFPAALLGAALAVFGTAHWATGEDSAPKGVAPPSISTDDALRQAELLDQGAVAYELDVSDSVFATLQRLQTEQVKKTSAIFEALAAEALAANELPEPVRRFQREALGVQLVADQKKAKTDFANQRFKVLNAAQLERLRQIDFQHQGVAKYSSIQVVKELVLTGEQQKTIAGIVNDFDARFMKLKLPGFGRVTSEIAEVVELVGERRARLEKILSAEQVTKIDALQGAEFDLTLLGPGPALNLYGIQGTRVSLDNARLLTHLVIRDELVMSAADHDAVLVAWQRWEDVRKEQTASDPKGLPAIKNTAAGDLLRTKLARNLWSRRYMKECEVFQDAAGRRLSDEQLLRLQQIEWQRRPHEMLLINAAMLTLSQAQFDSLSSCFALHRRNLDIAAMLDMAAKDVAIREAREAAKAGFPKVLTFEQYEKFVALRGKAVTEKVLDLPLDHKSNWPKDP